MEFTDFMLLRSGWNEGLLYEQDIARTQTFIIARTLGQKSEVLERVWPDPHKASAASRKMVNYKGQMMTEYQMKTLVKLKKEKRARESKIKNV